MKAADVMVRNVITVGPDACVQEVAHILLTARISGVPVVGSNGELVGVVSEGDLMRDFSPLAQTDQGLQQIRAADDADHLVVFYDWNALDRVLLEQICDLPERSVGGRRYHLARHHVGDLARMLPYEFHRQRLFAREDGKPPRPAAAGAGLDATARPGHLSRGLQSCFCGARG